MSTMKKRKMRSNNKHSPPLIIYSLEEETDRFLLNSLSIIKKIRIVKTELMEMNITLDIIIFFHIMIIVFIIFSSLQKGFFKV